MTKELDRLKEKKLIELEKAPEEKKDEKKKRDKKKDKKPKISKELRKILDKISKKTDELTEAKLANGSKNRDLMKLKMKRKAQLSRGPDSSFATHYGKPAFLSCRKNSPHFT